MSTFIVPGEPRAKARARFAANHFYTPTDTKDYEDAVGWAARDSGIEKHFGPIELVVKAFFPIPITWKGEKRLLASRSQLKHSAKPDVDNLQKLVQDALNGIAYFDDKQVWLATVSKEYSDRPRLEITIIRTDASIDHE